jgi:hypothetical protein
MTRGHDHDISLRYPTLLKEQDGVTGRQIIGDLQSSLADLTPAGKEGKQRSGERPSILEPRGRRELPPHGALGPTHEITLDREQRAFDSGDEISEPSSAVDALKEHAIASVSGCSTINAGLSILDFVLSDRNADQQQAHFFEIGCEASERVDVSSIGWFDVLDHRHREDHVELPRCARQVQPGVPNIGAVPVNASLCFSRKVSGQHIGFVDRIGEEVDQPVLRANVLCEEKREQFGATGVENLQIAFGDVVVRENFVEQVVFGISSGRINWLEYLPCHFFYAVPGQTPADHRLKANGFSRAPDGEIRTNIGHAQTCGLDCETVGLRC